MTKGKGGRLYRVGFAALIALSPAVGLAESQEWDQAQAAAVARELADAVKDLRVTAEKNPEQINPAQRRAQYEAREDLRLLVNTTRHLASELERGAGREETRPIYKRVQLLRRDAEENGRRAMIPTPTLAKIEVAQGVLARLVPYYEEE